MIVGKIHGMRRANNTLTPTGLVIEVYSAVRDNRQMVDIEVITEEGYTGMLLANGTRQDVDNMIHCLRALRERLPE